MGYVVATIGTAILLIADNLAGYGPISFTETTILFNVLLVSFKFCCNDNKKDKLTKAYFDIANKTRGR